MSDDSDVGLTRIEAYVCDLCFTGVGGECHVPGCAFWMLNAPTVDVLAFVRSHVEPEVPA